MKRLRNVTPARRSRGPSGARELTEFACGNGSTEDSDSAPRETSRDGAFTYGSQMTEIRRVGPTGQGPAGRTAVKFIVLVGVVSLFSDMTYEGARSITGPYLAILGASATVVGIVAGLGELCGYGLRLVSGFLADKTGRYWAFTIAGYALNLFSVPLLALAGRWDLAAVLMIAERAGKALRTPARDAMLSRAVSGVGAGWGFGLHEALDQIGAIVGPILVALVLASRAEYQTAFAVLLAPALVAMGMLIVARTLYPRPRELEISVTSVQAHGFSRAYWLYLLGAMCVAAGYADFPLIAYHFQKTATLSPTWIPIWYAAAMAADGVAALGFGYLFDKKGIAVLILAAAISCLFAPLIFLGEPRFQFTGVILWGVGMGAQESLMRAVIPQMIPPDRRGVGYGTFNMGFGLAWFLGSALMGVLYDVSVPALVAFSVLVQLASIPLFVGVNKIVAAQREASA
jgi:MFS family permease